MIDSCDHVTEKKNKFWGFQNFVWDDDVQVQGSCNRRTEKEWSEMEADTDLVTETNICGRMSIALFPVFFFPTSLHYHFFKSIILILL